MMIPSPLLDDISSGRCLPFIGAGFSLNAKLPDGKKMPDWKALTDGLLKELKTKKRDPLEVAQLYEEEYGRVQLIDTVRRLLHTYEVEPGSVHRAFARITSFETIYTTNFDFLLEKAYQLERVPHRVLVGERQLSFHAGKDTANIVKMHGDLAHEEYLVMTKKDYEGYIDNFRVISTHLSSMLITKTALFLGYSLTDPNFQQIREIIKERLGRFERKSYIVLFDASNSTIEKYKKQNLYVINLNDASKNKSEQLEVFLKEIYDHTSEQSSKRTISLGTEAFPEEKEKDRVVQYSIKRKEIGVLEHALNICFTIFPYGNETSRNIYFQIIKPVVEGFGIRIVSAPELQGLGGTILDNVRTTILQSRFIIYDATGLSQSTLVELGFAISAQKPLLIITRKPDDLPTSIRQFEFFVYDDTIESLEKLKSYLRLKISNLLLQEPTMEAKRLIELGHYRSAVTLIWSYLEVSLSLELRNSLDIGRPTYNFLEILRERGIIKPDEYSIAKQWRALRNKVVHEVYQPKYDEVFAMVNWAIDFADSVKKRLAR